MHPEPAIETPCCIVLTTVGSEADADDLARRIVLEGFGACVQVQAVKSFYRWQGELCVEPEWRLHIKSTKGMYPALEAFIRANHRYEVPEIVQLPVAAGLADYLQWVQGWSG